MRTLLISLLATASGVYGYLNLGALKGWLGSDDPAPSMQVPAEPAQEDGFAVARAAAEGGQIEKASGLYLRLLESPSTRAQARQELAAVYIKSGKIREGLTVEYRWAASPTERALTLAKIREHNTKVLNPADPTGGLRHVIAPSETLAKIAKKHGSNERLLQRINRLENPHRIHAGRALKVVPFKASIEVNLAGRELVVSCEEGVWDVYPVGVGAEESPSPTGTFTIEVMQTDPPFWAEPGKPPVPTGHPENPLGSRWMGFKAPYESFGIHGTNDEASVGHRSSHGCMRLTKKDVEELFDLVDYGTEVVIRER